LLPFNQGGQFTLPTFHAVHSLHVHVALVEAARFIAVLRMDPAKHGYLKEGR
jgi:hypothetical protein